MKTIQEIKKTPRVLVVREGEDGGWAEVRLLSSKKTIPAMVVFSWDGGWDHVSISFRNRTPTWEEMCEVKDMFFAPDEVVVQYHPAKSEYVNAMENCLHLWRKQGCKMPAPPSWMVGPKEGQSYAEARREGERTLKN